jgi:hypothetical protein
MDYLVVLIHAVVFDLKCTTHPNQYTTCIDRSRQ